MSREWRDKTHIVNDSIPMETDPIWTEELLEQLHAAGLSVTRNMIEQDVRQGYLPSPKVEAYGLHRGRAGRWDHLAIRRAFYLYRLRKRGTKGEVLRVLLFLRDGWGWEGIRPVCQTGLQKLAKVSQSQIKDHVYKPLTPQILEAEVDNISKDAGIQHKEIGRFIFGMGAFGKPLEGGSLRSFWDLLAEFLDLREPLPIEPLEQIVADSALTWEEMVQVVEKANAEQANLARIILLQSLGLIRRQIYLDEFEEAIQRPYTSNLLTLGGRSASEIASSLRLFPKRITPAQLLGAHVGIALLAVYAVAKEEVAGGVSVEGT